MFESFSRAAFQESSGILAESRRLLYMLLPHMARLVCGCPIQISRVGCFQVICKKWKEKGGDLQFWESIFVNYSTVLPERQSLLLLIRSAALASSIPSFCCLLLTTESCAAVCNQSILRCELVDGHVMVSPHSRLPYIHVWSKVRHLEVHRYLLRSLVATPYSSNPPQQPAATSYNRPKRFKVLFPSALASLGCVRTVILAKPETLCTRCRRNEAKTLIDQIYRISFCRHIRHPRVHTYLP